MNFDWKMKGGITILIIVILLLIAPSIFGDIFTALKDILISCNNTAKGTKLP